MKRTKLVGIPTSISIFLILIIIGIGVIWIRNSSPSENIASPELQESLSQALSSEKSGTTLNTNENVAITMDMLNALNWFHLASIPNVDDDSEIYEIIASTLTSTSNLETGIAMIDQHSENTNKAIYLSINGTILGAEKVIQGNNDLVAYLRSPDLLDVDYQTGLYLASQKDGYTTIVQSAPWVGSTLYEPASSENPTGKIPYTITDSERKSILNTIERLFGQELREYRRTAGMGDANSIIFTVNAIYDNLWASTYEEAGL